MKRLVVLVVLALMVVTTCVAQAQNTERLIVGTWTDNEDGTWIFSSDGTFTRKQGEYNDTGRFTGTQLVVLTNGAINRGVWNFSISSDGRTLILAHHVSSNFRLLIKN
jgi:Ni/Co efflux regulator RcnB